MSQQHMVVGSAAMHAFSLVTIATAFIVGAAVCGDSPNVAWAGLFVPNVVMQLFLIFCHGRREIGTSPSSSTIGALA